MIRKLVALAAGCAAACLASAALATTVTGNLAAGAVSSSLQPTANNPFSITVLVVDTSTAGLNGGLCFTVVRSQDGTNFAPLARDVVGVPARYCGPITIDLTEARSGTYYAIQADAKAVTFAYRLDQ